MQWFSFVIPSRLAGLAPLHLMISQSAVGRSRSINAAHPYPDLSRGRMTSACPIWVCQLGEVLRQIFGVGTPLRCSLL